MGDLDVPVTLLVLMGIMTLLVLMVWMGQFGISARLRRIEYHLRQMAVQDGAETPALGERKAETKLQKRLFQEYLDEDPYRRRLPKREQFAGFRKWRSEKGLNWGGEDKPA